MANSIKAERVLRPGETYLPSEFEPAGSYGNGSGGRDIPTTVPVPAKPYTILFFFPDHQYPSARNHLLDLVEQQDTGPAFPRVFFTDGTDSIEKLPSNRFKLPLGLRLNYFSGTGSSCGRITASIPTTGVSQPYGQPRSTRQDHSFFSVSPSTGIIHNGVNTSPPTNSITKTDGYIQQLFPFGLLQQLLRTGLRRRAPNGSWAG